MKKLIIIVLSIVTYSCEEPIDLDLNTSEPQLVIDASINWIKGSSHNFNLYDKHSKIQKSICLSYRAPWMNWVRLPQRIMVYKWCVVVVLGVCGG